MFYQLGISLLSLARYLVHPQNIVDAEAYLAE
jgi:hypothetical protein